MLQGDAGLLVNGFSHNSVNNDGLLFDDVLIIILSHQNFDFLGVPSLDTINTKG